MVGLALCAGNSEHIIQLAQDPPNRLQHYMRGPGQKISVRRNTAVSQMTPKQICKDSHCLQMQK